MNTLMLKLGALLGVALLVLCLALGFKHEQAKVREAQAQITEIRGNLTVLQNLRKTEQADALRQNSRMAAYQKEAQNAKSQADQYLVALRNARRVRWVAPAVQVAAGEAAPAAPARSEAAGGADVPAAFAERVAGLLSEADQLAIRYNTLLKISEEHTCVIDAKD